MPDIDLQTNKYLSKKQRKFLSRLQEVSSSIQKINDARQKECERIKADELLYERLKKLELVSPKSYMQLRNNMLKLDIEKKQYSEDHQQEFNYTTWLSLLNDVIQELQLELNSQGKIANENINILKGHLSNKSKYVVHINKCSGLSNKLAQIDEHIDAKFYKAPPRFSLKSFRFGLHKLRQFFRKIATAALKYLMGTDEKPAEISRPNPKASQTRTQRAHPESKSYNVDDSRWGDHPAPVLPKAKQKGGKSRLHIDALLQHGIHSSPRSGATSQDGTSTPNNTSTTTETPYHGLRHRLVTWLIIISTTLLPIVVDIMDFIDCDCGLLV